MFIGKVSLDGYPRVVYYMADPPHNLRNIRLRDEAKRFVSKSALKRFFAGTKPGSWNPGNGPRNWSLVEIVEVGPRGGIVKAKPKAKAKRKSAKKRA